MASKSSPDPSGGKGGRGGAVAKVTLWLGPDTLDKLDTIVDRGRFGSRGRAIDALLDSLEDSVEAIDLWNLAFRHYVSPAVTDTATRQRFDDEMRMYATRVWGRIGRFVELGEWDSPPLPSERPDGEPGGRAVRTRRRD
jgi:Arc/MetJ-type ribon-helix-helix transcriptional regulator